MKPTKRLGRFLIATTLALVALVAVASAQDKKPNILVIFGDDIGIPQISAYTQGLMGYRTPNIDRIAKEGALFTDSYGQQSCTAAKTILGTRTSTCRRNTGSTSFSATSIT
jgi:arylsulfatase